MFRTSKCSSSKRLVLYLPSTRLLTWTHARNTIKLHVQVLLRMNTWNIFNYIVEDNIVKLEH